MNHFMKMLISETTNENQPSQRVKFRLKKVQIKCENTKNGYFYVLGLKDGETDNEKHNLS